MFSREVRIDNALKVGAACALTAFIVEYFRVPIGGIAVLSVLVLNTVYVREPVLKAWHRFFGALICSVLSIVLMHFFIDLPFLYFSSMLLSCLMLFYFFKCQYYPYACLMGGATVAFIMTEGIANPDHAIATAFGWTIGVGLGLIVTWLFDRIWPIYRKPSPVLQVINLIKAHELDPEKYRLVRSDLGDLVREPREHFQNLLMALRHLFTVLSNFEHRDDVDASVERVCQRVIFALEQKARLSYLDYEFLARKDVASLRFHQLRSKQIYQHQNELTVARQVADVQLLDQMIEAARQIELAVNGLNVCAYMPKQNTKIPLPFFLPLNKDGLIHSFKICLGVAIMLCLQQFFKWPTGIQGLIAVIVLMATPNIGRAHWKLRLRVKGVFFGALLGLLALALTVAIPSMVLMVLLIFFTMAIAAFIGIGPVRQSYFGVQMGVMVPMMLLMTYGPIVNLDLPIERFVGALTGAIVAMFVLYLFWPKDPSLAFHDALLEKIKTIRLFFIDCQQGDFTDLHEKLDGIEVSDRSMLVDSQFILYQKDERIEALQAMVATVNNFAAKARALVPVLQQLDSDVVEPMLRLAKPVLAKAEYNIAVIGGVFDGGSDGVRRYHSELKMVQRLIRRVRARHWTCSLGDETLIKLATVEQLTLSLFQILDDLAAKLIDEEEVYGQNTLY